MLEGARVVVIVPAFNESPRIARVLRGMPSFVDHILVVDDASVDETAHAAIEVADARVEVRSHHKNRGVGAAIVTGYHRALALTASPADALVVMAGDGQMDPGDLPRLIAPIVRGEADYAKGDRFASPEVGRTMPRSRYLGGLVLSRLTSLAVGQTVSDSQCGYTALSRRACMALDLDTIWPRFGYPNDILGHLAARKMKIVHISVRPIYADEESKLRAYHVVRILQIVARTWVSRRYAHDGRERGRNPFSPPEVLARRWTERERAHDPSRNIP